MIVRRRYSLRLVFRFGLPVIGMAALWAALVFALYTKLGLTFLRIPFLPVATIGTAVAFYVGFKNNSSYDRFWEGRKIWGGIVNASRTFGTAISAYVDAGEDGAKTREVRRELIYRHLAWINALRLQLRKTSRFFDNPARVTKDRLERHAEAMRNDWDKELSPFLSREELTEASAPANTATQLLRTQGQRLAELNRDGRLETYRQVDLMSVIRELYDHQGKCERIKNTPFPRHYAEYSRVFVYVFTFLVPFGMLDVFGGMVEQHIDDMKLLWACLPMMFSSGLVTWVFFTMEGIGDATEDPFERSMSDVPMNALCRTIEIDLREMLGETELPEKEQPVEGILY